MFSFLYGPTLTPITTSGKTIALTIQTFAGKSMSLLFSMLSRFEDRMHSFIFQGSVSLFSQLQSLSTVILEPRKIKLVTVFIASPCICHEVMEWDAMVFVLLNCTYNFKTIPKKKKCKKLV